MTDTRLYRMLNIPSDQLIIEKKTYQRKSDRNKIAHIVSNWNERVANEPKVSARDGKYYVFDGQHTILAREAMSEGKPISILCNNRMHCIRSN